MHMMLNDTIVLGDGAYHSSDVMNDVTNSLYPAPDRIFSNIHFFILHLVVFTNTHL